MLLAVGYLFILMNGVCACTCSVEHNYCKNDGWCCGDCEVGSSCACSDYGTGSGCGERYGSSCSRGNSAAVWIARVSNCYDSSSSGAGSCTNRMPVTDSTGGKYWGCCCNAQGALVTDGHQAAGPDVCIPPPSPAPSADTSTGTAVGLCSNTCSYGGEGDGGGGEGDDGGGEGDGGGGEGNGGGGGEGASPSSSSAVVGDGSGGSSAVAIGAGVAVGVAALLCIPLAYFVRRHTRQKSAEPSGATTTEMQAVTTTGGAKTTETPMKDTDEDASAGSATKV